MATTEIRTSIGVSLKKAQIFSRLSEAEINSLAARAVRKIYDSGEQLFTEGDPCEGFYIITRGNVRIFKSSPGGREQVLAIEGPGKACVQACEECDTHRGVSMIHLETIMRADSVQTAPQVCMHCDEPICAQVCPADGHQKDR